MDTDVHNPLSYPLEFARNRVLKRVHTPWLFMTSISFDTHRCPSVGLFDYVFVFMFIFVFMFSLNAAVVTFFVKIAQRQLDGMRFSLRKATEHEPTVDPFDGVNNGRPRSLSIPLGFAYQLQSGRTHYPGVSCRSRLAPDAFGRVKSHGPDNGRPSPLCRAPQMFRFPSTRHYRPRSIRLSYNINFVS